MSLFTALEQQLATLEQQGLRRVLRSVSTPCAPQLVADGKPMLAFCSNDYLGLAAHPALAAALHEGVRQYGVGSGASHLISGHYAVHAQLEARLAQMLSGAIPQARALYFGSGYMANMAVITALAGLAANNDCTIFSETLNHASLIDGVRLARAKVKLIPHLDVVALQQQLAACPDTLKIVVTDGVFSMDGDIAPLAQMLALCEQYQAWLVVDDAHGFGVLGADGHGILQHLHLQSPSLIYMGTLGKAAGVSGAFVAADQRVTEWLIQRARPYIYTTAAPPAFACALLAALDLITGAEGRARRAHLQALIAQWQQGVKLGQGEGDGKGGAGWHMLSSETAIQPLIIGSNEAVMRVAGALRERGFWVPAIRPPTVAAGTARLRVTLSAAHTHEQVQQLILAVNELASIEAGRHHE
jgi:8-amino-7-oxononanoate synthase